jgi:hypothetical protein
VDNEGSSLGFTTHVPNVARIYDYYLGGKDNFEADREAARRVLGVAPDVPMAALENRAFLQRAVRFLVREAGIAQFIDIGPGLPTQSNVHQITRQYDPQARLVYVDNDPVVLTHGHAVLDQMPGVTIIDEDLREPERLLANPQLREIIDFAQPVALCLTLVLHFMRPDDDPYGIVERLRDALASGSYIVISHVTNETRDKETLEEITDTYDEATAPLVMRSRDEIARFYAGFEVVKPGVVFLSQWRPSSESYPEDGTRWAYAGVGRKTGDTR